MKTLISILTICVATVFAPRVWADEVMVPCRQAGDVTGDHDERLVNLTDAIYLLNYLFLGGPAPEMNGCHAGDGSIHYPSGMFVPMFENGNPGQLADINGDGAIDITDPIRLLNWLYAGGPEPEPMHCVPANGV